jgi:cobalamin synthase
VVRKIGLSHDIGCSLWIGGLGRIVLIALVSGPAVALAGAALWLGHLARRRIGGVGGDVLGAVQQAGEIRRSGASNLFPKLEVASAMGERRALPGRHLTRGGRGCDGT